jgi:hypothetical protein
VSSSVHLSSISCTCPKPCKNWPHTLAKAICEQRPQGPYFIGAFCENRMLTHEAAQQLINIKDTRLHCSPYSIPVTQPTTRITQLGVVTSRPGDASVFISLRCGNEGWPRGMPI